MNDHSHYQFNFQDEELKKLAMTQNGTKHLQMIPCYMSNFRFETYNESSFSKHEKAGRLVRSKTLPLDKS